MPKATTKLRVRQTINTFRALEKDLQKEAQNHLAKFGTILRRNIKARARVGKTGRLKASPTKRTNRDKTRVTINTRIKGTSRQYSPFEEFGVKRGPRKRSAHPFIFPAMEEIAPQFIRGVEQISAKSIRRASVSNTASV